jgi:hypothetical protein
MTRKLSARQRHERNDKIVGCLLSSLGITLLCGWILLEHLTYVPH